MEDGEAVLSLVYDALTAWPAFTERTKIGRLITFLLLFSPLLTLFISITHFFTIVSFENHAKTSIGIFIFKIL
jgi:hypothetical protein